MQLDEISPHVASLQRQIQSLSDLYIRLQALRQIPPLLLQQPISNGLTSPTQSLRAEFPQLKDIGDTLCSDSLQEALRTARESERADRTDINYNARRENRKRRRPPSPESPQPYISFHRRTASLFPMTDDEILPLRIDGLPDYVRGFNQSNQSNQSKLHIWSRTRGPAQLSNPAVVRFTIHNVLTAYVTLGYGYNNPALVVENITTCSPQEKKSPHSQSDYVVYQNLSQQIAMMLQSHPRVSFQNIMNLLCSYAGIFIDRCSSCERVLSAEGHVPPVVRIWIDAGKEGERGRWDPRHVTCRQT